MAVELTGYGVFSMSFSGGVSQSLSSIDLTDADYALVAAGKVNDTDFSQMNWDDGADEVDFTQLGKGGGTYDAFYYGMDSGDGNWPGSGSGKTLHFESVGQPGHIFVIPLKGVDQTTPKIAFEGKAIAADPETSTAATFSGVSAGDMIFGYAMNYQSLGVPTTDPATYGQTEAGYIDSAEAKSSAVGYEDGEDEFRIEDLDTAYGGIAWVAIAAASAGAAGGNALTAVFYGPLGGVFCGPI